MRMKINLLKGMDEGKQYDLIVRERDGWARAACELLIHSSTRLVSQAAKECAKAYKARQKAINHLLHSWYS